MLTIDKTKGSQRIVVTLTENATGQGDAFKLQLHSTYTNQTFEVLLGENLSPYPERYDAFELTPEKYSEWREGGYVYAIYEHDTATSTDIKVVEVGNALVIGQQTPNYLSIKKAETDDDFIVYGK